MLLGRHRISAGFGLGVWFLYWTARLIIFDIICSVWKLKRDTALPSSKLPRLDISTSSARIVCHHIARRRGVWRIGSPLTLEPDRSCQLIPHLTVAHYGDLSAHTHCIKLASFSSYKPRCVPRYRSCRSTACSKIYSYHSQENVCNSLKLLPATAGRLQVWTVREVPRGGLAPILASWNVSSLGRSSVQRLPSCPKSMRCNRSNAPPRPIIITDNLPGLESCGCEIDSLQILWDRPPRERQRERTWVTAALKLCVANLEHQPWEAEWNYGNNYYWIDCLRGRATRAELRRRSINIAELQHLLEQITIIITGNRRQGVSRSEYWKININQYASALGWCVTGLFWWAGGLTVINIRSVLREACRIGFKGRNFTKEDALWRLQEDEGGY